MYKQQKKRGFHRSSKILKMKTNLFSIFLTSSSFYDNKHGGITHIDGNRMYMPSSAFARRVCLGETHVLCGPAVPPSAFAHVFALSDCPS